MVGSPPLVAKYVSVKVVKACGNVVVDWYVLDVGQPTPGLGAHNNVAITTQGSDMHFTSSTVLLFSQTEVRGDEDDAAFGVLELRRGGNAAHTSREDCCIPDNKPCLSGLQNVMKETERDNCCST
ncbi:hypothetical protein Bbelb_117580 [Branchiostoma belcheri]|nr:hypothetical protein Bbelb_117580 [Branchiostoma belcheri]